jgi:hypothetical protein
MRILGGMLVAVAMLLAIPEQARAQEPTTQQYEAVMRWASGHQQILHMSVEPLQRMPDGSAVESDAGRAAWVSLARSWVASYRAQLRDVHARIASLGPVPEAGDLSAMYRRQHDALPSMIDGLEAFLTQYESGIDAVARNDPEAWNIAAINATDAQILIMTQFRNLNALQAESIGDGPQRYLLRSFASSYDGLIVLSRERRAAYLGQTISPSSIGQVRAAADAMRQHGRDGRASIVQVLGALPAQVPPDQSDFLRRVRIAYESFNASFDREDMIASHVASIADLLASTSQFANVDDQVTQHAIVAGELDLERGADIRRRTTLLQTVTPPT